MGFLDGYRAFVDKRQMRPMDERASMRLALVEPFYAVDPSTGSIFINTARVHLARHSRGMRRSEAARALGISLREYRRMECPNRAVFVPRDMLANLAHVFYYPDRFFFTFETKQSGDNPDVLRRQRADWRILRRPRFFTCYAEQ